MNLTENDMNRLGKIQDKYKFMDTFYLEEDDIYNFCDNILKAYKLGLSLEWIDRKFIETILHDFECEKKLVDEIGDDFISQYLCEG